jgi:hypothetical protein
MALVYGRDVRDNGSRACRGGPEGMGVSLAQELEILRTQLSLGHYATSLGFCVGDSRE